MNLGFVINTYLVLVLGAGIIGVFHFALMAVIVNFWSFYLAVATRGDVWAIFLFLAAWNGILAFGIVCGAIAVGGIVGGEYNPLHIVPDVFHAPVL